MNPKQKDRAMARTPQALKMQTSLRLPPDLYQWLVDTAAGESRSVAAQLEKMLKDLRAQQQQPN